mmetsp:Transcript_36369/g.93774  ORF Transcript_36369/g.93774 Transcript_36369/m.93774 type:complete len:233 (-) Transcript_36369:215-913(-)|eukprot:CAMPEP_0195057434 /NCGR_PEP_ID=MMETSP0448-20130528/5551_1 /TAXON_ID=66468 /ORGANISM="Heterocapsa triquestra, Strain CCMP 448" /LENGTH=232 /DNA_ID=CAMNT_0040087417 /DNA_START=70 /DNA_END=768 /DNA_ORIENTATION=-
MGANQTVAASNGAPAPPVPANAAKAAKKGKQQAGVPVLVHIYDLGTSGEGQALNTVLRLLGTGAFHCGVEVYGKEWSFRGRRTAGTGVFCTRPRNCEGHTYSETVTMGETMMSEADIKKLLAILEREWPGSSYQTLRQNCCHFSTKFCKLLGVGELPSWVTNLAASGAALVDTGAYLNQATHAITIDVQSRLNDGIFNEKDFSCPGLSPKSAWSASPKGSGPAWSVSPKSSA